MIQPCTGLEHRQLDDFVPRQACLGTERTMGSNLECHRRHPAVGSAPIAARRQSSRLWCAPSGAETLISEACMLSGRP